jgi:hypothetical protein
MHVAAVIFAIFASVAIIGLGIRFFLQPRESMHDYGVAADNLRALTEIKGIRDITSGVVVLVVLAAGDRTTLGWVLVAASLTAIGDAGIVLANGGARARAFGIHGLTATLLIAAGLVLALG